MSTAILIHETRQFILYALLVIPGAYWLRHVAESGMKLYVICPYTCLHSNAIQDRSGKRSVDILAYYNCTSGEIADNVSGLSNS